MWYPIGFVISFIILITVHTVLLKVNYKYSSSFHKDDEIAVVLFAIIISLVWVMVYPIVIMGGVITLSYIGIKKFVGYLVDIFVAIHVGRGGSK